MKYCILILFYSPSEPENGAFICFTCFPFCWKKKTVYRAQQLKLKTDEQVRDVFQPSSVLDLESLCAKSPHVPIMLYSAFMLPLVMSGCDKSRYAELQRSCAKWVSCMLVGSLVLLPQILSLSPPRQHCITVWLVVTRITCIWSPPVSVFYALITRFFLLWKWALWFPF